LFFLKNKKQQTPDFLIVKKLIHQLLNPLLHLSKLRMSIVTQHNDRLVLLNKTNDDGFVAGVIARVVNFSPKRSWRFNIQPKP
jgi:hypothetical protein